MGLRLFFAGILVFTFAVLIHGTVAEAAPGPCKGKNRDLPECNDGGDPPPPPPAGDAIVESVTVDWFNQKLIIRGSDFVDGTAFTLGATAVATENVTGTELEIPFSADMADEVLQKGNYNLTVDGTVQLSVFIESQVINPLASDCPCDTPWSDQLVGLWGLHSTACTEIIGPDPNDAADIAGIVQSVPPPEGAYPQFPIGASFYPGIPEDSTCRLVQIDDDLSPVELVNLRINELQQEACAATLIANVCITP